MGIDCREENCKLRNTTTDGLKGLQISYNILNLPQTVTQGEAVKATYGWFAEGAITASGVGIFSGILIGATGELTEQALNIAIGEQEKLDVVSIGISSISGGASAGLDKVFKKISSFIELNYKSSSIKKSIRDEVISENRKKGEVMGKSTKKDVNNEVKKRIIDYQEGNQFFVEKIKQILNVQVEVIEENIYEDQ